MEPTISVKGLRAPIFAAAVRTGKAPAELAALVGVAPSLVTDIDARVPHSLVARAWETHAALCNDPHLGLFAASLLDAAPLDVIDFALYCAPDLRGMVAGFQRFQRLFHDANEAEVHERGQEVFATFRLGPGAPRCRFLVEFVLGTWLSKFRRALGPRFVLTEVHLTDAPSQDTGAFGRVFGATPVRFEAAADCIVFPAPMLALPLLGADGAAWERLQTQLDGAAARREPAASFVDAAKQKLRLELSQGRAEPEGLARALAVSTRSLQRRLAEESTSFSDLLDEVRREMAVSQMNHGTVSVTEVAFLLGFADLSSFSRAFRRWTGQSPSAYRHAHAARPA
jgi:AraC-like DNA-binding protein